jgi:hypothetical protein
MMNTSIGREASEKRKGKKRIERKRLGMSG